VLMFSEESTAEETPKMDWAGVVTLGIAFLATYQAISEVEKLAEANWVLVVVLIVIAAVFFVVFWNVEKRKEHPMVTTHYLKQRRTWGLLLTTLLTMTGVFAIMNGVVPAIAQDPEMGVNLGADVVSFATLTPYALLGLCFGPVAGILASKFGYHKVLRVGLIVSIVGVLFGVYLSNSPSVPALVVISVVLGISYAGTVNIMLNGLGIVLSPEDNPGYLPGMNAGAFNLGAGLSFAVLYAVMDAFSTGGASAGYASSMIASCVLLAAALLVSFLIPRPSDADES
jgi:predicted MFS family arabinose efflux permease